MIDTTQLDLLDMEQEQGLTFYTAYLNNLKVLIKLYDCVLYREHFISLPGDEVIQKKHLNVKYLMAMERNEDIGKQETRTWPGLGKCVFLIDYEKLLPDSRPSTMESIRSRTQD